MENKKFKQTDIVVIGAGIIGAAIARELAKYNLKIVVLESDARVGMETTSGNSGLVHGGFDATPGKLNAKLNVLGKKRYEDWIAEMDFPYLRINSTVVAFNIEEMQHVKMLFERGLINGLDKSELEIIGAHELKIREPNISQDAVGALVCNSSIAVDPKILTQTLLINAIKNGLTLEVNSKVIQIQKENNHFLISTSKNETYQSQIIINAAGHYADVIAQMAGYPDFNLATRRGEYRILEKTESGVVNSVIFMVPTIHGKGVLVAPTLDGRILVGPTSEDNVPKAETRLVTSVKFDEIGKIGKKIIPNLRIEKTVETLAGSRAIHLASDDFYIKSALQDKNFINVAGIKSPGISSAPAIADMVCGMVEEILGQLEIKPNYDPRQKSILPLT
ncbi:type 2 glycerol-3-phosphate oxidase [Williamsoniiplasma lucivorax]|uniref:Glycerol-3-phospate oxidase n=1 Tax=Williamsoniiplasma lucivorax TaxID=209274 RepID=A0A2S5RF17_9MOLU|nr:type 2 glycerol-3-phosphate oxidase [Williamsoniiplasma lucivorax]PPE05913.1 glycerol-3-phospate oxidase [Williamsoniiplasma lucivorax]